MTAANGWGASPQQERLREAIIGGDDACGRNCLFVALDALGVPVETVSELEQWIGAPPVGGYSLAQLQAGAEQCGLFTLGVQTTLENLARRPRPFACIAHDRAGHFVLVTDVLPNLRGVRIIDPPHAAQLIQRETFEARWSGQALLISTEPLLSESELPRPVPWFWLGVGLMILAAAAGAMWWRRRQLAIVGFALCFIGCDAPTTVELPIKVTSSDRPAIEIAKPHFDPGKEGACEMSQKQR
jgi:ABC-type bacteriocin/lantibiotic exporter with double-glycine peptidase domain